MDLLLDTHPFLWYVEDSPRLPRRVKALMADPQSRLFLSVASVWEVVIKTRLGKLHLNGAPEGFFERHLAAMGIVLLPIHFGHVLRVGHLPAHHNDPFDRLLIAQSQVEHLPVLTMDDKFDQYTVDRVRW